MWIFWNKGGIATPFIAVVSGQVFKMRVIDQFMALMASKYLLS